LRARNQPVNVDTGGFKSVSKNPRIVHLLRLLPHVVISGAKIGTKHAFELSGNNAAHQHQRVDRKKRILVKLGNVMPTNETLRLQRLVFRLVLDTAKRVARRHVASRLVDPAEQDRHIIELHAGPPLDRRNDEFR